MQLKLQVELLQVMYTATQGFKNNKLIDQQIMGNIKCIDFQMSKGKVLFLKWIIFNKNTK